jgi:adenosylhomocysteine nucleosidase
LCQAPVIAVTSLALEARIARGPGIAVVSDHASRLDSSLRQAVSRGAAGIISFGVAGGLAPDLVPGDWIVASGVWTSEAYFPADPTWAKRLLALLPRPAHLDIAGADAPLVYPAQKRALYGRSGAAVVDTESHIAARTAGKYRIPFAACRVVLDPVEEALPPAAEVGLRDDGSADVLAVLMSVARQPKQLWALVRIACHAAVAQAALRKGRRFLGVALACPQFNALAEPASALDRSSGMRGLHPASNYLVPSSISDVE